MLKYILAEVSLPSFPTMHNHKLDWLGPSDLCDLWRQAKTTYKIKYFFVLYNSYTDSLLNEKAPQKCSFMCNQSRLKHQHDSNIAS